VFGEPVAVDGRELLIGMAAGIAVYPGDGDDVDELLAHASAAKARVLQGPGHGYQFYTTDMQERVLERLTTEVALYRGLERGEFELHFQPMVDVARAKVVAVEALLRWNRPGHGLQAPDSFIPLLEQTGLVMDTGDWVLRSACKAVRDLPLSLAVNMSPSQFRSPHMAGQLMRILEETGFPPDRLELEITEQIVMEDDVGAVDTLRKLGALGIRVALDDYGTGFSSLQRLKKLPLHTLKIDKSFVTRLISDREDLAIVRSTIDMCHQLGIVVVAEGVEDRPTLARLQELGCDVAQGYGLCRPLTLEALQQWLISSPLAGA
jgi:EAL domain-containing protein (putative c-di-GMP-specific phosphodiesterase class I)